MSDREFFFFRVVYGEDAELADFDTRTEADAFASTKAKARVDEYVSSGSGWAFRHPKERAPS